MATLILSTTGRVIGGPIGGAIGALIGQQVDNRLFAPADREGPRLDDLRIQTSSYGTPLPKIFGTMRVAGTVVWATGLKETREREGGGKGRPGSVTYSYSASFAVALSSRPILGVKRIWADGKLLRGEAGDWKSETVFRLHPGREGQGVDPLIASAEGVGGTPAYRGLALAVFEDLQLADFGNRIPSLSFEVEADTGAVGFGAIVEDLAGAAMAAQSETVIGGYAADGPSIASALATLLDAFPHGLSDDGSTLSLQQAAAEPVVVAEDDLGAAKGADPAPRIERETRGAEAVPDEIALRHYEPARDFQAGLQRARHNGPGRRAERIDLPVTLEAATARGVAAARLERHWSGRQTARVRLPWRRLELRPAVRIRFPDMAGEWRVEAATLESMALILDCVRVGGGAIMPADAAEPGRSVADPDLLHGPTVVHLLDLPALDGTVHQAPRLLIAAAGLSPGWRSAALEISLDGGASYVSIGSTAAPATMGETETVLPPGSAALFDDIASVDVALLHEDMWLEGRTDDALVGGANAALIGDEIVQFGRADPIGAGRFRLSRLLRGRRGTEWVMESHVAGERFVLLEPDALKAFDAQAGQIGAPVRLLATGQGDEMAVSQESGLVGRSVRPPSAVHVRARREDDGSVRFAWERRSRAGWSWTDGADAPLAEDGERWALVVTGAGGAPRTAEIEGGTYLYAASAIAADGAAAATQFTLQIARLGSLGRSLPDGVHVFDL